jgi:NADH-quinone oxidoreductase subunit G
MVKIFIDGNELEVKEGTTVLNAAEQAGIAIPHFCYHSAFPPEGSCRMCLVEIEGLPKLELACSTVVREGLKVLTKSQKVIEARKGVLEFLLAEHPLDCPICDKAGDCKLQDYYHEYGLFESHFDENKEKRDKKVKIGKSLILDQERCILCTRCVRFLAKVTKTEELGVFNRGLHSEINIYEGQPVSNNYSGNLAEICPVGAITDEDFRFKTRNWFLRSGKSICPLCSRGCNIIIEYHPGFPRIPRAKRVYRVKALENKEVNGFWICDRGRYGYSYLDQDRLDRIVINDKRMAKEPSWPNALAFIIEKIKRIYNMKKTSAVAVVANTWLTNEELFVLRKISKEDLKIEKIYFADTEPGEGDGFLLTSERSPNRRGAQEMGFDLQPLSLESLAEGIEILFVFGSSLSETFGLADLKNALEKIETKVLFTPYSRDLNSLFDIVFPSALIAEKGGSLTNIEGEIQSFSPVLEPPGESLPEWKMLVDLAKELGINFGYFRQFSSPGSISAQMAKEISFFRKKSD